MVTLSNDDNDLDVPGVAIREAEANRQRGRLVIAHSPFSTR